MCLDYAFCYLKQTQSKYDEVLPHCDSLSKPGIFLMWKILEMKKICPFFFYVGNCKLVFVHTPAIRLCACVCWGGGGGGGRR